MKDEAYMKMAIELAKRGAGYVAPNPMVGAVIVKDGKVIGKGWHKKFGALHAEPDAILNCGSTSVKGATLYVTLEPCCHYGKTPPCTKKILESGIKEVVIGTMDPNPLVAGKGIEQLKQGGVSVKTGICEAECIKQNEVFFHYIRTKRPFVVMKYAMTMDGKIATYDRKSKWITGAASREKVQRDRHCYSAIMVGSGTVLADDPMLDCRMENGINPIRIICDTRLLISLESRIVRSAREIRTLIATGVMEDESRSFKEREKKRRELEKAGVEILQIPMKGSHLDFAVLCEKLGIMGIDSILLEGGATLNWSALESKMVNQVQTYIAPKIFGGKEAVSPIEGQGVAVPEDAYELVPFSMTQLGKDLLIESEVKYPCLQES